MKMARSCPTATGVLMRPRARGVLELARLFTTTKVQGDLFHHGGSNGG